METNRNADLTEQVLDELYVCAGICREDTETGRCMGCGRPWGSSSVPAPAGTPGSTATKPPDESA